MKIKRKDNLAIRENKTKSGYGKLKIALLFTIMILAVIWSVVHSVHNQYKSELDATYESMANSMYAVRNLIDFEDSLQESYNSFDLTEAKIFTKVAKQYFDYNEISEGTLSDYALEMEDCSIYFYHNDGTVVMSDNADTFSLGKSQMRMLRTMGELQTDDYDYTAVRLDDGWLCFQWQRAQDIYNVDYEKLVEISPSELCVIENATGKILVSSGKNHYDFLDEKKVVFDTEHDEHEAEGIQAGYYNGNSVFSGVYFEKIRQLNRYSVFTYIPLRSLLVEALKKIVPEYGLMFLCFAFIWICAGKMRKQGKSIEDRNQCLRLGKKYYINLPVARRVASLLMVGVLLVSVLSAYLPLLNNYADHNDKMEKNLSGLVSEMELSNEEWEKIEEIFHNNIEYRVSTIANFMKMMGKDFTLKVLQELTDSMDFVNTVVYDDKGVAEMSTDGYIGYKLSQNEDDDEYVLWKLLNNADVNLMEELSDGSGFFAAVRRTDAPGLICATLTDNALSSMKEKTDINAAFLRINTNTYAKMYVSAEETDTLLWATASASKVRSFSNNLPDNVLINHYFGTNKINGYEYYLNTIADEDNIFISVEQSNVFTKSVKKILTWIIPESLLIALIILCSVCLYRSDGEWLEKEAETGFLKRLLNSRDRAAIPEEQELDISLKKTCARFLKLVFAMLVALFFADMLFSKKPISSCLFSNQWEHEFGIFSITTILLSVAFAVLGMGILKAVLKIVSGKVNSRAATIGNLATSIVQFLVIMIVVIYSLYQLGVDTSVILTSAGVVSLIIGYGSQSVVSDLVSGIFLIMEDQVRIGDVIYIDGFRGDVIHIGLRTTTVQRYNNIKVVNNSKMVGFYNLSRMTAAARWTLSFTVDQDIDQVKSLIMDNAERFQKACKGRIKKGPICVGVTEAYCDYVGTYYYTIMFLFVCDMDEWNSVRKRSFETAYRIMLENGITPAAGELGKIVK